MCCIALSRSLFQGRWAGVGTVSWTAGDGNFRLETADLLVGILVLDRAANGLILSGVIVPGQMQVTAPSMSFASLFAKKSISLVSVLRPLLYEYGLCHLTILTGERLCAIPLPPTPRGGSYRLFCQPCGSLRYPSL